MHTLKKRAESLFFWFVLFLAAAAVCAAVRASFYLPARESVVFDTFTRCDLAEDSRARFLSEPVSLSKGTYVLRLETDCAAETEIVFGSAERLQTENAPQAEDGIAFLPLRLSPGGGVREVRITVETGHAEAAVLFRQYYEGALPQPVFVRAELVYRPLLSAVASAADTLLFAALLFLLFACIRHGVQNRETKEAWIPLLLYVLVVFISLPMFGNSVSYGHDTIFHVRRIASLAEELANGRIPARLSQTWKNGYGYPVHLFYGDLFLVPAAVLFQLGVPLFRCYQFYCIMMNAAAVLISFHCFRKISGQPWLALAGGTIYTAGMRYQANLYLRGALGEDTAMAVLPLTALGFYVLFRDTGALPAPGDAAETQERRRCPEAVCYLTTGFTALIQAHTLTTILAAFFAFLFCLFNIRTLLKDGRLKVLVFSAALTAVLNLWFIVPFVDYYTHHSFYAKMTEAVWETAVPLSWLVRPESLHQVPGPVILCVLLFSVILFAVHMRKNRDRMRMRVLPLLLLCVLSLWMGTALFPWQFLSEHLPFLYGILGGRLQYVWRYFSIAALLVCVFMVWMCTNALPEKPLDGRKAGRIMALFLPVVLACTEGLAVRYEMRHPAEEKPVLFAADVWNGDGGDALYLFDDVSWLEMPEKTVLADEGIAFTDFSKEGTTCFVDVENSPEEAGRIAFPVWNYHGYTATLTDASGQTFALPVADGENHRVSVEIPAGFSGSVTVAFREPWYWRVAEAVSLLTLLGVVVVCAGKRKYGKINVPE